MSESEKDLSGVYTLKTHSGSQAPGERITLSHEDAKRFLAGGHVHPHGHYEATAKVGPLHDPKFDPHFDADHILPRAEFMRWMDASYDRYVQQRMDNRDRNKIFAEILAKHPEGLPMVPAQMPPKAKPNEEIEKLRAEGDELRAAKAGLEEQFAAMSADLESLRTALADSQEEHRALAVAVASKAEEDAETQAAAAPAFSEEAKAKTEADDVVAVTSQQDEAIAPVDDKPKDTAPAPSAKSSKAPKAPRNMPIA